MTGIGDRPPLTVADLQQAGRIRRQPPPGLSECNICGAAVLNHIKHRDYHANQRPTTPG